jgi:hypothetical protein
MISLRIFKEIEKYKRKTERSKSLSLCFVPHEVEKSIFHEDLEGLINNDFKENDSKK